MAPPVFTISAARQKFFDLFQTVTARHGRKVIIAMRGRPDHAVLVSEAYLSELETAATRLRDIEAGHSVPADEFRLLGSGRIAPGAGDPVAAIRADAQASWERKLASLAKDP